ncbi:MAG: ABC transporter permease [Phototrophicaceae bacterium]|jgi:peptide/nickel transport system permease protein
MGQFVIRRVLSAIPVLFGIVIIAFAMLRFIPGDPCRAVLGERATDEICDAYFERVGLNEPVYVQFFLYIGRVLQGDLGTSLRFGLPISELLISRMPTTVELTLAAILFAILVGVPLGIISAYYHNSPLDVGTMIFANIGVSMPVFWLGAMLSLLFGVYLRDTVFALPPTGSVSATFPQEAFYFVWGLYPAGTPNTEINDFVRFLGELNLLNGLLTWNWALIGETLRFLVLPAITVGTIPLAITARMTRSSVLEVLNLDYIRTARAKGLGESAVVVSHALRNALLPVVTVIGLNFGLLISGAVLTETVFGLTGIGLTLVDAIESRDYVVVQAFTLITASAFVVINLLVDILYAYLDPRIRLD